MIVVVLGMDVMLTSHRHETVTVMVSTLPYLIRHVSNENHSFLVMPIPRIPFEA